MGVQYTLIYLDLSPELTETQMQDEVGISPNPFNS
jgi:hypothetical protein